MRERTASRATRACPRPHPGRAAGTPRSARRRRGVPPGADPSVAVVSRALLAATTAPRSAARTRPPGPSSDHHAGRGRCRSTGTVRPRWDGARTPRGGPVTTVLAPTTTTRTIVPRGTVRRSGRQRCSASASGTRTASTGRSPARLLPRRHLRAGRAADAGPRRRRARAADRAGRPGRRRPPGGPGAVPRPRRPALRGARRARPGARPPARGRPRAAAGRCSTARTRRWPGRCCPPAGRCARCRRSGSGCPSSTGRCSRSPDAGAVLPSPGQLRGLPEVAGLTPEKVDRLHGVAEAALTGALDVDRLRALDPAVAEQELQALRGGRARSPRSWSWCGRSATPTCCPATSRGAGRGRRAVRPRRPGHRRAAGGAGRGVAALPHLGPGAGPGGRRPGRRRVTTLRSDHGQRQQRLAGGADLDVGAHARADAAVEAGDPAAVVELLLVERLLPVGPEPLLVEPGVEVVPGQDLGLGRARGWCTSRRRCRPVSAAAIQRSKLKCSLQPSKIAAVAPDLLEHRADPAVAARQQALDDAGLAVVVAEADGLAEVAVAGDGRRAAA